MDSFALMVNFRYHTIIGVSDGHTFTASAKRVYQLLIWEKMLAWVGAGNHFDYYDNTMKVGYGGIRLCR